MCSLLALPEEEMVAKAMRSRVPAGRELHEAAAASLSKGDTRILREEPAGGAWTPREAWGAQLAAPPAAPAAGAGQEQLGTLRTRAAWWRSACTS